MGVCVWGGCTRGLGEPGPISNKDLPRFAKKSQERRLRAPCASSRLRNSLTPIQTSPQPLLGLSLCSLPSTPPPTHREREKVIAKGAQGRGAFKGGRPGWRKLFTHTLAPLSSSPLPSKGQSKFKIIQPHTAENSGYSLSSEWPPGGSGARGKILG